MTCEHAPVNTANLSCIFFKPRMDPLHVPF